MSILIRAWRAEDIPAIAHIMTPHILWQRYGVTPASALARVTSLHQQGELGLVADDHDTLVGFALFHTKTFGGDGYIRLFSVDKNCTSTGIGPYLLATVETHLLSIGVKRLVLLSAHGNEGARRFYERHHFVLAGRLTNWVIDGKDESLYTNASPRRPQRNHVPNALLMPASPRNFNRALGRKFVAVARVSGKPMVRVLFHKVLIY